MKHYTLYWALFCSDWRSLYLITLFFAHCCWSVLATCFSFLKMMPSSVGSAFTSVQMSVRWICFILESRISVTVEYGLSHLFYICQFFQFTLLSFQNLGWQMLVTPSLALTWQLVFLPARSLWTVDPHIPVASSYWVTLLYVSFQQDRILNTREDHVI